MTIVVFILDKRREEERERRREGGREGERQWHLFIILPPPFLLPLPFSLSRIQDHTTFSQTTHSMFLYGDICEVYKHIVQFTDTCVVFDSAESTEPKSVPVHNVDEHFH